MADVERPSGGITPFLAIAGKRGREACDHYVKAFGGEIVEQNAAQDGERLMQASLKVNGGWVMLADEFPEFGHAAAPPASVMLHLMVDDTDRWHDRAVSAGCTSLMAPADQFWGDRYAQVKDPFGHSWAFGTPLKR